MILCGEQPGVKVLRAPEREIFRQPAWNDQGAGLQGYWWYLEIRERRAGGKDPLWAGPRSDGLTFTPGC